MKTEKIISCDLIRIIATMMVFMLHTLVFTNTLFAQSIEKKFFFFYTPAWAGVWIFLILSGYLIGKSYRSRRYLLDRPKDVFIFYLTRVVKIGIPTFFFVFLCCVLLYPSYCSEYKMVIIKILTFTFNGENGVNGIGATWYVSTIMQLYLLAPFIIVAFNKISGSKWATAIELVTFITIGLGLCNRLLLYNRGLDWNTYIYTLSLSNLDLFISGIALSYIEIDRPVKKWAGIVSWILFLIVTGVNTYLYYMSTAFSMFIYQYIFPSVYILSIGTVILCNQNMRINNTTIKRIVNWFSNISFQFYLWHSLILSTIYQSVQGKDVISYHVKLLLFTFAITSIIAWFFTFAFDKLLGPINKKIILLQYKKNV